MRWIWSSVREGREENDSGRDDNPLAERSSEVRVAVFQCCGTPIRKLCSFEKKMREKKEKKQIT